MSPWDFVAWFSSTGVESVDYVLRSLDLKERRGAAIMNADVCVNIDVSDLLANYEAWRAYCERLFGIRQFTSI